MHVRLATRADLPAMISIGEEAFMDDELNAYRWPRRFEYPHDYHRTQVHRNLSAFAEAGTYAIVCVADEADVDLAPPETILGLAYWWRQPAGKLFGSAPNSATFDAREAQKNASKEMSRNRGIFATVERCLLRVDAAYRGLVYPDRSVCTKEAGDALAAEFMALDPFARLPSHFHCNLLAVSKGTGRRGVGSSLVQWGIDRARAQGVPCSLSSSNAGKRLYERMGFRIVDWPEFCVRDGWEGGACFVWDPWNLWTTDYVASIHGREVNCAWVEYGGKPKADAIE